MHVSRYITNEMEVMLDQFWFWSASPTFPYFRHDFSDTISSNCGIPWIFHGFSDIFLPSSSADAVTPTALRSRFCPKASCAPRPSRPVALVISVFVSRWRTIRWVKKTQTSMDLSMQEQLWFNLEKCWFILEKWVPQLSTKLFEKPCEFYGLWMCMAKISTEWMWCLNQTSLFAALPSWGNLNATDMGCLRPWIHKQLMGGDTI